MSGGRGPPKTGLSFNTEALGIGRGKDAFPTTVLTPPPLYPVMTTKAKKPLKNDETDRLLSFYKDFRRHIKESTFYIKLPDEMKTRTGVKIERYSDKFHEKQNETLSLPDWSFLPKELHPSQKNKGAKRKASSTPNLVTKKKKDVLKKLDELEAKEINDKNAEGEDGDEEEKDEEEDEAKDVEEVSDAEDEDEELDEGTDYANNYFDNGEGYLEDDDDGLDEGGIY